MQRLLTLLLTAVTTLLILTPTRGSPAFPVPCGKVLTPSSPSFANASIINNMRFYSPPKYIVIVKCPADVSTAILYAKTHNLTVAAKSGSHSAMGYCQGDVNIDFSALTSSYFVDPESGLYAIEAGTRWVDVYQRLNGSCWQAAGGGCPTVGVSGYTLGGGISFASRTLGLAADQLVAATVVTADGEVLNVGTHSPPGSREEDLFWAMRGGGGGNFVVSYNFTFQLGRAPACEVTGNPDGVIGGLTWSLDRAAPAIAAVSTLATQVLPSMPYVSLPAILRRDKDGIPSFTMTVVANEAPSLFYAKHLPALLAVLPKPDTMDLNVISLPAWELATPDATAVHGNLLAVRSGVFAGPNLVGSAAHILVDAFAAAPSNLTTIIWHTGGGAIASVGPSETAFVHRDFNQIYEIKALWKGQEASEVNIAWADALTTALRPLTGGASYVNYIDSTLPNWRIGYYGANYPRLAQIACQWDPDNVFAFEQGISCSPSTQSAPSCTESQVLNTMAAFQDAQNNMDAERAAALFTLDAVFSAPIGQFEEKGRANIQAGFASYFASLYSIREVEVTKPVVSANWGAFSKEIFSVARINNAPCNVTYAVDNWFEMECAGTPGSTALISQFAAVFNTTSQAVQKAACLHHHS